jgi:GNAT superfamily N-acetyltransferase
VQAIKQNWTEYYYHLGRAPTAELHSGPHLTWLLTGIPSAFNNVVLQTRLPPDGSSEIVGQALAHFRSKNVARLSWWIDQRAQETELPKLLVAHGLTFNEGGTGMAMDLHSVPQDLPTPAGLTIVPVEDKETLRQWVHVANLGFSLPLSAEGTWFDLFAGLVFDLPLRNYLAILNGQPVGTSQLFLGAGVAGVYNVTCLPEARGRGVGAAITLAPLLEARNLGYRISILQASHLGYPVYSRLGFQGFGKLSNYLWENETKKPEAENDAA